MSDEREKVSGEAEGEREKVADVEAHRLQERVGEAERVGEPEEKREEDGADVEGHILAPRHGSGKMES